MIQIDEFSHQIETLIRVNFQWNLLELSHMGGGAFFFWAETGPPVKKDHIEKLMFILATAVDGDVQLCNFAAEINGRATETRVKAVFVVTEVQNYYQAHN